MYGDTPTTVFTNSILQGGHKGSTLHNIYTQIVQTVIYSLYLPYMKQTAIEASSRPLKKFSTYSARDLKTAIYSNLSSLDSTAL